MKMNLGNIYAVLSAYIQSSSKSKVQPWAGRLIAIPGHTANSMVLIGYKWSAAHSTGPAFPLPVLFIVLPHSLNVTEHLQHKEKEQKNWMLADVIVKISFQTAAMLLLWAKSCPLHCPFAEKMFLKTNESQWFIHTHPEPKHQCTTSADRCDWCLLQIQHPRLKTHHCLNTYKAFSK